MYLMPSEMPIPPRTSRKASTGVIEYMKPSKNERKGRTTVMNIEASAAHWVLRC